MLNQNARKITMAKTVEKENLLGYVREFLSSTEDLINAAGKESGEKLQQLHQHAKENLKVAKTHLLKAEKYVANKANNVAYVADEYVHENPWKAVGIASVIGLFLGLLISRR